MPEGPNWALDIRKPSEFPQRVSYPACCPPGRWCERADASTFGRSVCVAPEHQPVHRDVLAGQKGAVYDIFVICCFLWIVVVKSSQGEELARRK